MEDALSVRMWRMLAFDTTFDYADSVNDDRVSWLDIMTSGDECDFGDNDGDTAQQIVWITDGEDDVAVISFTFDECLTRLSREHYKRLNDAFHHARDDYAQHSLGTTAMTRVYVLTTFAHRRYAQNQRIKRSVDHSVSRRHQQQRRRRRTRTATKTRQAIDRSAATTVDVGAVSSAVRGRIVDAVARHTAPHRRIPPV